jgi:glutathione S-transferase
VVTVLEELGVPYEFHLFAFNDVKKSPFININPNGRVPGTSKKKKKEKEK